MAPSVSIVRSVSSRAATSENASPRPSAEGSPGAIRTPPSSSVSVSVSATSVRTAAVAIGVSVSMVVL